MQLPTSPAARGPNPGVPGSPGAVPSRTRINFTEVFLGAFRRDIQSFYPGSRIERETILNLAGMPAPAPGPPPPSRSISSSTTSTTRETPCGSPSSGRGIAWP